MLSGAWISVTLALVLIGVLTQQTLILLAALLFFFTSGVARLWTRYALDRMEYKRSFSVNRAFFGETINLELGIANLKILPVPWLHIRDEVPEELTFLKGVTTPTHKPSRLTLPNFLSLGWYHRITRRYPIQCLRRGYFSFGPATIRSGDLFGFFNKQLTEEKIDRLLVYPRIVPLESLDIPSRNPFGDMKVRQHLFQDPVRVATIREYQPGDPLKHIHWKASARLRRLQSRVFEPTTAVDLSIFLDQTTGDDSFFGAPVQQELETAVLVAASVASYAVNNGYRVGLYANELYANTRRLMKLSPSDHPDQLTLVLEALAQVRGLPFGGLDEMLDREARSLPWDSTMVVISASPQRSSMATLHRYRRAGRRVALILIGERAGRIQPKGIPVYHVSDQVYWREVESLRLTPLGDST